MSFLAYLLVYYQSCRFPACTVLWPCFQRCTVRELLEDKQLHNKVAASGPPTRAQTTLDQSAICLTPPFLCDCPAVCHFPGKKKTNIGYNEEDTHIFAREFSRKFSVVLLSIVFFSALAGLQLLDILPKLR